MTNEIMCRFRPNLEYPPDCGLYELTRRQYKPLSESEKQALKNMPETELSELEYYSLVIEQSRISLCFQVSGYTSKKIVD